MASLNPMDRQLLKEALEIKMRKEEFEHALGRVLRKRDSDFERYIALTSELRALRKKGENSEAVARRIIAEE